MNAAANKPPITLIEPEDGCTYYVTGTEIEAIDTQTVQVVAWVEQPITNSRKIVLRLAMPLKVAMEANAAMHKAIVGVVGMLVKDTRNEKETLQ